MLRIVGFSKTVVSNDTESGLQNTVLGSVAAIARWRYLARFAFGRIVTNSRTVVWREYS